MSGISAQSTSINSAARTSGATTAAMPAHTGHDLSLDPGIGPMPMPPRHPAPYPGRYDFLQSLIEQLRMAIEQLQFSIPHQIHPPYDPYQYGNPHQFCDHFPIEPPITIDPVPPMVQKRRPEVGDRVGTLATKTGSSPVTVGSVHRTFGSRREAVAEAKRLASGPGDHAFGIMQGFDGRFAVVGLKSRTPITADAVHRLASRTTDGWTLDAVATDAKTVTRITAAEAMEVPIPMPARGNSDLGPAQPAPETHEH